MESPGVDLVDAGERGNLGEKLLAACGGGFGGQNRLRRMPMGLAALSFAADRRQGSSRTAPLWPLPAMALTI